MSNDARWSLRGRVLALCVTVGLVLAGLAVAEAVVAAQNKRATDRILTVTGPLRVDGQVVLNALVNQETGIRGYAVTGELGELDTYRSGVEQERAAVGRMRSLLRDSPTGLAQLEEVEQRAERWRRDIATPVIDTTRAQGRAAGQALLTDAARQQFDELRGAVTALQQTILRLRQQGAADVERTGNLLVALLILAAVVVVLAGVALLLSLNRLVIGPVTALARQVREVATGDYTRVIERVGPPEVARLAADVDGMRRKIAADLAEVRAARTSVEEANERLQKQAEELVRSNRDLEQFAYVASHDLQEPLRKVASFCQLLQRRYAGQLDERADQYIAFAVDGAQRMQRLINDLLAFSRIGRLTSGFGDVDLNKVMGDVAAQTEVARQYTDAELTWSTLPVIRGEEALLTNLIANLVSNSLKFRRPDVPPRVHVSAERKGDEWEIVCRDNGIGIEPEYADKIFVIFQRLHSKDAYPGTGIGLAIVKKIVEYHGGRVWVDPEAVEGSAIHFTLPVAPETDVTEDSGDPGDAETSGEVPDAGATEARTAGAGGAGTADNGGAPPGPGDRAAGTDDHQPSDGGVRRSAAGPAGETDGMKETVA